MYIVAQQKKQARGRGVQALGIDWGAEFIIQYIFLSLGKRGRYVVSQKMAIGKGTRL